MGRTRQIACPSTAFHSVVPTTPVYTIVPVVVKVSNLLPALAQLRMTVLVLSGSIFLLPMASDRDRASSGALVRPAPPTSYETSYPPAETEARLR